MRHEDILLTNAVERFKSIEKGADPYPTVIEIHPTDVCNQGCEYCFHGGAGFGKDRDPSRYLKPSQYLQLFQEFSQLGIKDLSMSGGGEPFLSRDIESVLSSAIENRLSVRIVTNGNFIPENLMPYLMECSEIRFSLDTTDPATYARVHNVNPSLLEKTFNNMRKILEIRSKLGRGPQVGATFIVNPENSDEISHFASVMLEDIGVDRIIFKHDVYGRYLPKQNLGVDRQLEYVKARWDKVIEIRSMLGPFVSGLPCVMPFFESVINPYGELYSCCLGSQPGEINGYFLGNLANFLNGGSGDAFQKVWEQSREVREAVLKEAKCLNCNYTDRRINEAFMEFQNAKQT